MKRLLATLLVVVMMASMVFVMASCGKDPEPSEPTYTYNTSLSEFPDVWNPHTYQTATDATILDYASVGFYSFDYNEAKDGYKIVPEMAVDFPVDVTAEYAEKYGIDPSATAQIWKITLRQDLKWEDGSAINAHDFVESAKLLLNPQAQNYRADSLYSGSLAIVGAQDYLYQGQHVYVTLMVPTYDASEYVAPDGFTTDEEGHLLTPAGNDISFKPADGGNWSSNSLNAYYNAGYFSVLDEEGNDLYKTVVQAAADESGNVVVTQEIVDVLNAAIAQLHGFATADEYAASVVDEETGETVGVYAYQEWQEFCYLGTDAPETSWDTVGVFAPSDYELVLALTSPLEGFYLHYALGSSWLVNIDLYKSCESVTDGIYTNTYGTSVETFMSYGPYKLTYFEADKQIKMTKNDQWYGHKDHPELYQTTDVVIDWVQEASTRLELFLQGKLDVYGLSAEDMADYQASDHTYYTTSDSTFFIALNPDFGALEANQGEGKNKTILTIKEFRMALSFSLDRMAFCLATSPVNNAAFGVFSSFIVADAENGITYRSTDQAKNVLVEFWGLSDAIGEGKTYATVDEAIASITGYNPTMGKEYFDKAYDAAIAAGMMSETDVVEIKIGLPNSTSSFYANGYEFLVNNYTEAVKGTKLEGKLTFTKDDTLGNGFSDALKNNTVDMLFGVGWTGSALDPYGLIEAYTAPSYQYDDSYNFDAVDLTIEIDGVEWTASALDWTYALGGADITIVDADGNEETYNAGSASGVPQATRLVILAALEGAVLETYNMIPLIDDSSAALKGMQIKYYTEEYIYGVGRGGIKYMTYNMTDAEWEAFVAENNGVLNYK